MPELPEVETIVRELNKKIKNKRIKAVKIKIAKMVNLPVAKFNKKIIRKQVKEVSRRGKMIIIKLTGDIYLLIHLKMTGQLIYRQESGRIAAVGGHPIAEGLKDLPNKFTHAIFTFTDGSHLFFNDLRKFGWLKVVDDNQLSVVNKEYGIEPLTKDFTFKNFREVLAKYPRRKIKQLLMDQSKIAGIGNIYADESCFCAKIKPSRLVKSLKEKEIQDLFKCIPQVMRLSINKGGTSADSYVRTDGTPGGFIPYLKVYGRQGEKCKRCQGVIQKIKLNVRGTHYCSRCQE